MNSLAKLTAREAQIAELFAWCASKRDVASRLQDGRTIIVDADMALELIKL